MHNSSYWPGKKLSREEERFNHFLHTNGIPYLLRVCQAVGIKTDTDCAGTIGVSHAHVQFMAYNMFDTYYQRGRLDTLQEILDFSFNILGDRITLN